MQILIMALSMVMTSVNRAFAFYVLTGVFHGYFEFIDGLDFPHCVALSFIAGFLTYQLSGKESDDSDWIKGVLLSIFVPWVVVINSIIVEFLI